MASLAVRLSETAPTWGRAVAPYAESVARMFWSPTAKGDQSLGPATRLTQSYKREAKGSSPWPSPISPPRRENLCRGCGKTIQRGSTNCADCAMSGATERLVSAAKLGRLAARNPEARAKHVASRRRHAQACSAWNAASQPAWLTGELYSKRIQPLLALMSSSAVAKQIGVSRWYAGRIRQGYRPHQRHWQALAQLVGVSPDL